MKTLPSGKKRLRLPTAAAFLFVLVILTWSSGRAGVSSFQAASAALGLQINRAETAVKVDPHNPDAHYVRATILESTDLPRAVAAHYQAVQARPEDYVLWLSLARAAELNGDIGQAIAAARQALPLAPDYAQPHYQLGNILLRAGQRDEAFKELRLAGRSNPALLAGIIDLAWQVSNRDAKYVQQALAPDRPESYLALGEFFKRQKQFDEAIAMYSAGGTAVAKERQTFVGELIATKHYREAAKLWSIDRSVPAASGVIIEPGFERETNLRDGFGWSLGENDQGVRLSLDRNQPREGAASLKVEFNGNSDPLSPVMYQLVLVDPETSYQLSFAIRAENLVTGGLPLITVIDADANGIIAQSDAVQQASAGWSEETVNFKTAPTTTAIRISLQRQPCAASPCPIFGRLWLDNFSLKKL